MTLATNWMLILSLCTGAQPTVDTPAEPPVVAKPLSASIRASLRTDQTVVPVGSPVFVEFVLQNRSNEPVTLSVPDAIEGKPRLHDGMGLPLEHVYSGAGFRGLAIATEANLRMGDRVSMKPQYPVPPITIAAFGTVGVRFDVARHYPGLHQSGTYVLSWKPYGGVLETKPLTIKVVAYKQAIIETNLGAMRMDLFYGKAPQHVENFLELANQRFYNGKTFHMVVANQFLLGGCPNGDGTGKRADGATLKPEINDTPFRFGTVGMAIIEGDANSGSCQFFICLADQPSWKGRYTAFGRIRGPESEKTLRKLSGVRVGEDRSPLQKLTIKNIAITDAPFVPRQLD